MTKHVKPTLEELDQGAEQALKEAEAIKAEEDKKKETDNETLKKAVEEVETPEEEVEETTEEEVEEEPEVEEKEEKPKKVEVEEPEEEKEDYKKKFVESTKEGQILYSKNKKMMEALSKVDDIPEPTEEELQKEFTDWEIMSDFEKRLAKNDIINSRKLEQISKVNKEFKDTDAWNGKVDEFVSDPNSLIKYPGLEGKESEFKIFANKTTRRGVDFEDLVSSFLYTAESERPKNKGKMLESTTGDTTKQKPKSNKISIEQARILRQNDYNKWSELLRAGKIESDI